MINKVAIVTLNGYHNYGNRLQNFALQEALKSLGFAVETLVVESVASSEKRDLSAVLSKVGNLRGKSFSQIMAFTTRRVRSRIHRKEYEDSRRIRTKLFREFTTEFITETAYSISEKNIPKNVVDAYDFFVVGSDQVWNPHYTKGSPLYFLLFAPKYKRISYAASFGITEIPDEYSDVYKKGLLGMEHISVRENDGATIIKDLIGAEARVHLDPTLLLTKEEWLAISTPAPNKPREPYVLNYFLGGTPNRNSKLVRSVGKNELQTINLGNINEKDTYRTGPSEFIDYINDCTLLCTDSFHGAVFAILLNKPFIVYERDGNEMFSRLNTLLQKFNFESRKAEQIETIDDVFNINFSHVPNILELERKKAFVYLRESLGITNTG